MEQTIAFILWVAPKHLSFIHLNTHTHTHTHTHICIYIHFADSFPPSASYTYFFANFFFFRKQMPLIEASVSKHYYAYL